MKVLPKSAPGLQTSQGFPHIKAETCAQLGCSRHFAFPGPAKKYIGQFESNDSHGEDGLGPWVSSAVGF